MPGTFHDRDRAVPFRSLPFPVLRYISLAGLGFSRLNAPVHRDSIGVPFALVAARYITGGKKDLLLGSGVSLLSYRHDVHTEYANEGVQRGTIRVAVWPMSVAFRRITR